MMVDGFLGGNKIKIKRVSTVAERPKPWASFGGGGRQQVIVVGKATNLLAFYFNASLPKDSPS